MPKRMILFATLESINAEIDMLENRGVIEKLDYSE